MNARDTQELIWLGELVGAIHRTRSGGAGRFEDIAEYEAAIEDLNEGRWNWKTINAVMQAHRTVMGDNE